MTFNEFASRIPAVYLKAGIAIELVLFVVLLALPAYWDSKRDDVDREIQRQAWESAKAKYYPAFVSGKSTK